MYEFIDNNPFYKIFWLGLVGVLVALAIWGVRRYVLALLKDHRWVSWLQRWEYRIVVFVWAGYAGWALFHLIKVNFLVTGVLLAIVLFAGWRSWMEFYNGLLLRIEGRMKIGDTIETESGSGRIDHFYFQSLTVMSLDGQLIHLPYSKITGGVVGQRTDQARLMAQSFTVSLNGGDVQMVKDKIENLVFSCPWTAVLHPVQITITGPGKYRVSAKTIDNDMFYKLENYVGKRLASQFAGD